MNNNNIKNEKEFNFLKVNPKNDILNEMMRINNRMVYAYRIFQHGYREDYYQEQCGESFTSDEIINMTTLINLAGRNTKYLLRKFLRENHISGGQWWSYICSSPENLQKYFDAMYLSNISKEEFYKKREETKLEYEQKKIATTNIPSQTPDSYFEEFLQDEQRGEDELVASAENDSYFEEFPQDEQIREDELVASAELVIGHPNRINAHSTVFPQMRMVKYKKPAYLKRHCQASKN